MSTKEETWRLPYNMLLWRPPEMPEGEYRWFQEIEISLSNPRNTEDKKTARQALMGSGYFDKKPNCLCLTSWEEQKEGFCKTDKEWEEEIKKYSLWDKSKYILKLTDIGFGLFYSDGGKKVEREKEIDSVLEKYPKMFQKQIKQEGEEAMDIKTRYLRWRESIDPFINQ